MLRATRRVFDKFIDNDYIDNWNRLELANLWFWRLGGLWEVATTLVVGG